LDQRPRPASTDGIRPRRRPADRPDVPACDHRGRKSRDRQGRQGQAPRPSASSQADPHAVPYGPGVLLALDDPASPQGREPRARLPPPFATSATASGDRRVRAEQDVALRLPHLPDQGRRLPLGPGPPMPVRERSPGATSVPSRPRPRFTMHGTRLSPKRDCWPRTRPSCRWRHRIAAPR
jgi:hypothetical protein